ncbi:MAG: O-antigen ligase family protein, partial [Flavobacterium sp.]
IQTDASNVERINRWSCAVRMGIDEPVFGFGPGMYQFEYGRFQLPTDLTNISTFHGNKGHAHSEILGALAESGFPGMLLAVVFMFSAIGYGLNVIYNTKDPYRRWIAYAALLGLVSFYVHGFFNAFLDTDKMAILVFGSIAVIIATDLENRKSVAAGLTTSVPDNE